MPQKPLYPLLAAGLACLPTCAQAQTPADSATFLLHKFAQRIGKETYRLTRSAQARTYDVDLKFVDRGSPVALRAQLALTPAGEPLLLAVKGQTSRFSSINDTVRFAAGQARVIQAEGKTVLPGLWDMHAHFQQAEWGPAYLARA